MMRIWILATVIVAGAACKSDGKTDGSAVAIEPHRDTKASADPTPAAPPAEPVVAAAGEPAPSRTVTSLPGFTKEVTIELPSGFAAEHTELADDGIEGVRVTDGHLVLELIELVAKDPMTLSSYKRAMEEIGPLDVARESDEPDAWLLVQRQGGRFDLNLHAKAVKITCSAEGLDSEALEKAIAICRSLKRRAS